MMMNPTDRPAIAARAESILDAAIADLFDEIDMPDDEGAYDIAEGQVYEAIAIALKNIGLEVK